MHFPDSGGGGNSASAAKTGQLGMSEAAVLYLVCSDRAHSGKTLLARLLVDWLLLREARPQVIDLDAPVYPLARLYPDLSTKVDFDHTPGRVALFDGIVSQPEVQRVLELPVVHMEAFLREAGNLEFFEAVVASGAGVAFLHLVDRAPEFVDRARRLAESLPTAVHYHPVRSVESDGVADHGERAGAPEAPGGDGAMRFPRLSADAVAYIERPDFSFARLMNGESVPSDVALRFKLQQFAKTMFAQFNRVAFQIEIKAFRDSGVV